jgi:hypothetical protein
MLGVTFGKFLFGFLMLFLAYFLVVGVGCKSLSEHIFANAKNINQKKFMLTKARKENNNF